MTRSKKASDEAAARILREAQLPLWTDEDIARWESERSAGRAGKETGMARAISGAAEWIEHAYGCLVILAASGAPFTSEDVTAMAGLPTGETGQHANNAVGALMNAAAREGIIRKTGRHVPSRNRTSHATEINEWRGI